MVTLGLSAASFAAGAESAKAKVSQLGSSITSSLGAKLAGVFSGAALGQAAARMLEIGGHVQDLSNKLGISTDAVQKWDFALKQNGSSIESAVPFFQKLAQARQKALEGNDDAIADFRQLGISMDMLKSSRIEDIAATIAKGFEAGDPQQLIAPLVSVGGKGALAMAAAFRDGLAGALQDAPLISAADIEALDEAADTWSKLKAEATSMFAPLVASILGFVNGALDAIKILLGGFVGAMQGVAEAFAGMSFMQLFTPGGFKKMLSGAFEGAQEGFMAMGNLKLDEDEKAQKKRDRLKKGNTGAFDPEGIEDKAATKEKEKLEKERDKQAREAEQAQAKAQREAEHAAHQEAMLNSQVQSEVEREMKEGADLTKRTGGTQFGYTGGAFGMAAGPEMAAMTAQIKSEDHLRQLKEYFLKKREGESALIPETDVKF